MPSFFSCSCTEARRFPLNSRTRGSRPTVVHTGLRGGVSTQLRPSQDIDEVSSRSI